MGFIKPCLTSILVSLMAQITLLPLLWCRRYMELHSDSSTDLGSLKFFLSRKPQNQFLCVIADSSILSSVRETQLFVSHIT